MSRIRCALLAISLCCALSVGVAPRQAAFGQDTPTHEDFEALLKRLEQAEAEIQDLRQQQVAAPPSSLQDEGAIDGPGADGAYGDMSPGGPVPDNSWMGAYQNLEQRFQEFKESLTTKKKAPYIEVHAAVQADSGWYGQDATNIKEFGVLKDGAVFRRTRLAANGAIADNVNYFVQMDFSFPGRPTFTDVWVEVTKLPLLGNIRAGQWKQPFSLEVVSSFRYTMMPERSLLFNSFTPFRHPAVGFYDWSQNERMTWAASVYRSGQDQFGDSIASSGGYAGVGRITGLPWYEDEGSRYLHLGVGYNYVTPVQRFAGFRTIPEFFIGQTDIPTTGANGTAGTATPTAINGTPFFVNTGNFFINHYNLVGTETLWVEGPLTVQSEFMYLSAVQNNGITANFAGFYTQVGYFLTGEHRPYMKKAGALDRIKVLNPFGNSLENGYGWGGWEICGRASYVDLNSNNIRGGRLADYTACLNWYLNSYTKIQMEYILADLNNPKFGNSKTNLYDLRIQWDF